MQNRKLVNGVFTVYMLYMLLNFELYIIYSAGKNMIGEDTGRK